MAVSEERETEREKINFIQPCNQNNNKIDKNTNKGGTLKGGYVKVGKHSGD